MSGTRSALRQEWKGSGRSEKRNAGGSSGNERGYRKESVKRKRGNVLLTQEQFTKEVLQSFRKSGLAKALRNATPEDRKAVSEEFARMFGFNAPMPK